jgi:hypothetical protein
MQEEIIDKGGMIFYAKYNDNCRYSFFNKDDTGISKNLPMVFKASE